MGESFWPPRWRLSRAQRLVNEAAKMYRLDAPSPTTMQEYLDEADNLLRGLLAEADAEHESTMEQS